MENATHKNLYELFPAHFGYTHTQFSFLFDLISFFVSVTVEREGKKKKEINNIENISMTLQTYPF